MTDYASNLEGTCLLAYDEWKRNRTIVGEVGYTAAERTIAVAKAYAHGCIVRHVTGRDPDWHKDREGLEAFLRLSANGCLDFRVKPLEHYRRLADFLSDAIESGRLTEADLPDDYKAIVETLATIAGLDPTADYYTLRPKDVGSPFIYAFGHNWQCTGFIGRILTSDVGRRVFKRGDVLQVESLKQREDRS